MYAYIYTHIHMIIHMYLNPILDFDLDHQIARQCGAAKNKPSAMLSWVFLSNPQMVVVCGIGFTMVYHLELSIIWLSGTPILSGLTPLSYHIVWYRIVSYHMISYHRHLIFYFVGLDALFYWVYHHSSY